MITAQRLLTELGNSVWSGFNAGDMVFTSNDSAQARTELNRALRYLVNKEDFPFRSKEKSVIAMKNNANTSMPEGQITSVYNKDNLKKLRFLGNSAGYDKTLKGEPTGYWIENNNPYQKLRFYPIPDDKYNYSIVYNQYKPVLKSNGETSFEFTNSDDYLNMPETYDYLFMDCLVMRTMMQNNKDDRDENYKPMINEFDEMWRVFKRACKPAKTNTMVVW